MSDDKDTASPPVHGQGLGKRQPFVGTGVGGTMITTEEAFLGLREATKKVAVQAYEVSQIAPMTPVSLATAMADGAWPTAAQALALAVLEDLGVPCNSSACALVVHPICKEAKALRRRIEELGR